VFGGKLTARPSAKELIAIPAPDMLGARPLRPVTTFDGAREEPISISTCSKADHRTRLNQTVTIRGENSIAALQ
jgi:hypothetical protein